jgi:hypothetical protein
VNKGEQCLVSDEFDESRKHFEEAADLWKDVRKQFPNYKESVWYGVTDFQIVARRCQAHLFQGNISKAVSILEKFSSVHNKKTTLAGVESQILISQHVQDLKNTCQDLADEPSQQQASKKGKSKNQPSPVSPKKGTVFDFMQLLKTVAVKV